MQVMYVYLQHAPEVVTNKFGEEISSANLELIGTIKGSNIFPDMTAKQQIALAKQHFPEIQFPIVELRTN